MNRAANAFSTLVAVMRNRNLRRLELAWGASITAEWMHFIALGIYAYEAGGTVGVGVAGLVRMLPAALIAPVAASLGDRFRRERFLLAVFFTGALALYASCLAFYLDANEYLVYALAGVVGVAATLVRPAQQALLPSLAGTPEELVATNGATSTIESLGTIVGPLLAGVLVASADVGVAFGVGSAAFFAAVLLFAGISVEGQIHLRTAGTSAGVRRMLTAGFRVVAGAPKPRLVIGLITAQAFVRGCLNVLIVVTVFEILEADAGAVGYLNAALGVGGLIGAVWALTLRAHRLAVPFGVALVFWGLPIALVATWTFLGALLVLLTVIGVANSIEDVTGFTLLQRIVPDEVLTRVLGLVWGLVMGAVALGSIAAPAVVSALGPVAALIAVGAILPVLILLSWRGLVNIDRTTASHPGELAIIQGVPILAPLSLAAKEHLAANLDTSSVAAGDIVIRQGEIGDRFYIVTGGEFEIVTSDRRTLAHEGDYFGEIALLRDVPRTATVTALAPSELVALSRAVFLAAVSGHSGALAAGQAIVEERLARPS